MTDLLLEPNEDLIKSENTITFLPIVDEFFKVGETVEFAPKSNPLKSGCNISKQEYIFPTVGILFFKNTSSTLFKYFKGSSDFNICVASSFLKVNISLEFEYINLSKSFETSSIFSISILVSSSKVYSLNNFCNSTSCILEYSDITLMRL